MNDIQIFNNPEFGDLQAIIINGEMWFVGKEIADKLGYQNGSRDVNRHVDKEDKRSTQIRYAGQDREMVIINESGLYSLIFGSKLESAKRFKHWVTSEVLPSIRRTGGYEIPKDTDGKIALLAQGHTELSERVNGLEERFDKFEKELPLMPDAADDVSDAVKKRGVEILGGKESNAYNNRGLRQKLYNNLYANLKYNFKVRKYKQIKNQQKEDALRIIAKYEPPYFLQSEIDNENAQGKLNFKENASSEAIS